MKTRKVFPLQIFTPPAKYYFLCIEYNATGEVRKRNPGTQKGKNTYLWEGKNSGKNLDLSFNSTIYWLHDFDQIICPLWHLVSIYVNVANRNYLIELLWELNVKGMAHSRCWIVTSTKNVTFSLEEFTFVYKIYTYTYPSVNQNMIQ